MRKQEVIGKAEWKPWSFNFQVIVVIADCFVNIRGPLFSYAALGIPSGVNTKQKIEFILIRRIAHCAPKYLSEIRNNAIILPFNNSCCSFLKPPRLMSW